LLGDDSDRHVFGRSLWKKNQRPLKKEKNGTNIVISKKKEKEVTFLDDKGKSSVLPITKALCVKCGNNKAYWIIRQMRSSDEPESRFYT
jgi:DNA-directed RNA polymerase subunit M